MYRELAPSPRFPLRLPALRCNVSQERHDFPEDACMRHYIIFVLRLACERSVFPPLPPPPSEPRYYHRSTRDLREICTYFALLLRFLSPTLSPSPPPPFRARFRVQGRGSLIEPRRYINRRSRHRPKNHDATTRSRVRDGSGRRSRAFRVRHFSEKRALETRGEIRRPEYNHGISLFVQTARTHVGSDDRNVVARTRSRAECRIGIVCAEG